LPSEACKGLLPRLLHGLGCLMIYSMEIKGGAAATAAAADGRVKELLDGASDDPIVFGQDGGCKDSGLIIRDLQGSGVSPCSGGTSTAFQGKRMVHRASMHPNGQLTGGGWCMAMVCSSCVKSAAMPASAQALSSLAFMALFSASTPLRCR
jgi:hypothetical protein